MKTPTMEEEEEEEEEDREQMSVAPFPGVVKLAGDLTSSKCSPLARRSADASAASFSGLVIDIVGNELQHSQQIIPTQSSPANHSYITI